MKVVATTNKEFTSLHLTSTSVVSHKAEAKPYKV